MSNAIRVGNFAVAAHVAALYGYFLQDAVAAMIVQDFQEGSAVDADFRSIVTDSHRVVVYQHFVAVYSSPHSGVVDDAFFVPHDKVVPTSVLDRLVEPLPDSHALSREAARPGGLGRIRNRVLEALQHGGLRRLPAELPGRLRFVWLATNVFFDVDFDADNRTFEIVNAWFKAD